MTFEKAMNLARGCVTGSELSNDEKFAAITALTQGEMKIEQLEEDSRKLGCLEAAGVDNWVGYGEAMEMYEEGEDD